jgi:uroporphyrinogen decarboxylase
VEVLRYGSTEQVTAAARECIRQAYDNPRGFVLGSGCSLALDTPPRNVLAMMDAARVYGKLPVDPERLQPCMASSGEADRRD